MTLIFRSGSDRTQWWVDTFREKAPDIPIRLWDEAGDDAAVEYALVWDPTPGRLACFPNLKMIMSLGAGVDHLFRDPDLPRNVPLARVVDVNLTGRMTEYVVLYTLRYHRQVDRYEAQQREKLWKFLPQPGAYDRTVGIMGLGVLGRDAAEKLVLLGFKVAGWSRSPKDVPGVEGFHGEAGLEPFLAKSEILVCLLPLTDETRGIIDAKLLATLPKGAWFINVARGGHVVDEDLIAALDSGQIAGATLDVFHKEPLPADHPFWGHPGITLTPHAASLTDPRSAFEQVVENVRRARAGKPLMNPVDPAKGY